ncbi:MAG: type II toxin-antitoxin system RelB family antitoxin [Janthinobacterium lividum]
MTTSVRFSQNIEQRLNHLAKETHRTKTYYIQQAVEDFLEEQEDYYLVQAVKERIDSGEEKLYSLEEAKKILGLKKS